jgi:aryl-alcohol dehydrogenase-like predicted oxidoreductase
VEETAEFIGEYVKLYQVHSATFASGILVNEDAHAALSQCRKDRGWKLGLSVSGPDQNQVIREAMKLKADDGTQLFDSVQCTFNLLEQRPADALREAHENGMDIIIKEGLANGRVLQNECVLEYSKKLDCKPDQLALGCILAQPFVPRVLSGAVTPEQLSSNVEALQVAEKLQANPDLLQEIMQSCVVSSEDYWAERSALKWN